MIIQRILITSTLVLATVKLQSFWVLILDSDCVKLLLIAA